MIVPLLIIVMAVTWIIITMVMVLKKKRPVLLYSKMKQPTINDGIHIRNVGLRMKKVVCHFAGIYLWVYCMIL